MQIIQAIILGLTQGLTEFIPVSSSGHLILVGHWLHFSGSGLAFDTALDIGTLAALLLFFRHDFVDLFIAIFKKSPKTKLAWLLILATIPGVLLGLALESKVKTVFRTDTRVAINLIVVAVIMLIADRVDRYKDQVLNTPRLGLKEMTAGRSLGIGLAQAIAVIPGVSRSGITISVAMFEGFDRVSATRFSFLLSAPIIAGATLKEVAGSAGQLGSQLGLVVAGVLAAAISGYWAIKFMLKYLEKHGLSAFAYYRIVAGLIILAIAR